MFKGSPVWHNVSMESTLLGRFLRYVSIDTMSDSRMAGSIRPSTPGQKVLMQMLRTELEDIGCTVHYGPEEVLQGCLAGNIDGEAIAFMAHVDTADDVPGNGVVPIVHSPYDGKDIVLDGVVIKTDDNPDLLRYRGGTVITSSGNTLLGSDDKAGVAIIMEMLSILSSDKSIPHPDIEVYFTPDEETGHSLDVFPYDLMKASVCYTVDGTEEGVIDIGCFNASAATIKIQGHAVHPGEARGVMRNALQTAAFIAQALPRTESPEATSGEEGFYAAMSISGTAEMAELSLILRDFEKSGLRQREEVLRNISESAAMIYGTEVECMIEESYCNFRDTVASHPYAMKRLRNAASSIGLGIKEQMVRGGTDGAHLASHGIASPDIFTGGHNLHSLSEWVALESMEKSLELVLAIARGDE